MPPRPAAPEIDALAEAERLLTAGQHEAAIAMLGRAAEDPRNKVKALTLQAQAYANLGSYDRAMRSCRSALAADNLAVAAHYLLAHLMEEQGNHDDAMVALKRVLYLDPKHAAAYLDFAALYARAGDVARARQMRLSAYDVLKTLPAKSAVAGYAPMTAGELADHVQRMLQGT